MDPKAKPSIFAYFDEQIDAVRAQLRPALMDFDETAVHQARVATRRLKAGFDVLGPLLDDLNAKGLNKAGRTLRRRLGPLRDLDVMIGHLAEANLPAKLAEAVDWVREHFEAERKDERSNNSIGEKKLGKLSAKFDDWWRVKHSLEGRLEAVSPLLTAALHERFDAFALLAERVAGVAETSADAPPVDIHELRIDGKAVRYAFELATAYGLAVPKKVAKAFKAMQDTLGDWHDEVVLAERILLSVVNADLPLHRPLLAAHVLDVARAYLGRSEKSLRQFKLLWKRDGADLRVVLQVQLPLVTDAEVAKPENEISVIVETELPVDPAPESGPIQ